MISFGWIILYISSYGDYSSGPSRGLDGVSSYGVWKGVWIHGEVNSFPVIHYCMVRCFGSNCSLWVFWFYRYRRPQFYEYLVRKEKGLSEGVNVIWLRSSKETDEFLRSVGGKIHGEIMEISQEEKDAAVL